MGKMLKKTTLKFMLFIEEETNVLQYRSFKLKREKPFIQVQWG